MTGYYLLIKYLHVLIAIMALGGGVGLGVLQGLHGGDVRHRDFILRVVRRLTLYLVLPGYLLMALTGALMVQGAWSWQLPWVERAAQLWIAGLVLQLASLWASRQRSRALGLAESGGAIYRRWAGAERILGTLFGLVFLAILYYMVFKPA